MDTSNTPIRLFYWSEIKFSSKNKENYGDLLSKYLVEKISGKGVEWIQPNKQPWYKLNKKHYFAIGSILQHASKASVVWGSGIIDTKQKVARAEFKAVRGPRTRDYLIAKGYECPAIFGDPALLLPNYYSPAIRKDFKVGIIPHYQDYSKAVHFYKNDSDALVIDLMTMDIEKVTQQILSCEIILSSSLHGLIVSHAFQIPGIWVEFSNKLFGDGIKFSDYMDSVEIEIYKPPFVKEKIDVRNVTEMVNNYPSLPTKEKILELQKGLLESCPFI